MLFSIYPTALWFSDYLPLQTIMHITLKKESKNSFINISLSLKEMSWVRNLKHLHLDSFWGFSYYDNNVVCSQSGLLQRAEICKVQFCNFCHWLRLTSANTCFTWIWIEKKMQRDKYYLFLGKINILIHTVLLYVRAYIFYLAFNIKIICLWWDFILFLSSNVPKL